MMELAYWNRKPLLHYFRTEIINNRTVKNLFIAQMDTYPVVPQLSYYQLLLKQYPNSMFILMKRNVTAHINSIDRWNNMRNRTTEENLPYLPAGRGKTDKELTIWIEGHYERVTEYFDAVAPHQLLVVSLEEQPAQHISEFLHCPGNHSWPHSNANQKKPSDSTV